MFPLVFACLLASVLAPAWLVSGCGGASDGSRPARLKVEEPVIRGDLRFSNVTPNAGVNALPLLGIVSFAPATLTTTRAGDATRQKLTFAVDANADPIASRLALSLDSSVSGGAIAPFRSGERLSFPRAGSNIEFAQTDGLGGTNRFRATSGAVIVERADAGGAQVRLDNLRFEPVDNAGLGAFSLSGTLVASQVTARG